MVNRTLKIAGATIGPSGGVMDEFTWTDTEEIGFRLSEAHPGVKPFELRFTELHQMVTELEGFVGDPKKSGEKILEAIQLAWVDELED